MPDTGETWSFRTLASIHDIPASKWDACAGDANPFLTHTFLAALEDCGAVCGDVGWMPRHLAMFDASGQLHGVMPLYLKRHSYGEYVFDWGWAEAFERAGGRYYPKLQAAVPFTPVAGRRLLVHPRAPASVFDAMATAAVHYAARLGVSSLHVTFATAEECEKLQAHGFMTRLAHQYHWQNRGYRDFDDFLAALSSRKRKAIRKERQAVAESGVTIRRLSGGEIEPHHWDAFWQFYQNTIDRKWAHAYLNRAFFTRLGETMADRVVLFLAETASGNPVAGALNLRGSDTLYGRYWGCVESCRFLHFELCYYRAIDYALENGLDRVEAGAQGEHKVQRGYLPCATWSAHWIAHPGLRRAVQRFLDSERPAAREEIAALDALSPFRRADAAGTGRFTAY